MYSAGSVPTRPLWLQTLELRLTVWAPLSVHVLPPRQTVDVGKSADLVCQAAGFPRQQVRWLKDGRPLRALGGMGAASATAPAAAPPTALVEDAVEADGRLRLLAADRLHIAAVAKDDRGMYQCVVRNENDMAQGAAELRLGGRLQVHGLGSTPGRPVRISHRTIAGCADTAPTLLYKFIEQTMQPGPSVSLKCSASGNPTPHMAWKLDGFPLPPTDRLVTPH